MEDFRCKARLVERGHMTKAPATITYASVVTRVTVRIAMMIIALNDIKAKTGVMAPVTEKVWTTLGHEFGNDTGKTAVIVRALYGLKSAGAVFSCYLARCIESMWYESCRAILDLWLKAKISQKDGVQYYSYLLCYVDG